MNVCPECFENAALKRRLLEICLDFPDDERCEFHPSRKTVPLEEVGKIVGCPPSLPERWLTGGTRRGRSSTSATPMVPKRR